MAAAHRPGVDGLGGAAGALALRTQLPPAWLLVAAVVAVVLGVVALRGVHH